ncbi:Galactose oxidase/kelch beta-propeller [Botryosphaeria dothidea]|uniref:Galactose oxidase/kelch beta-propeller n=1 Tax=Botryosphaeria dothidea TaxID=55169 RepID=A0A8H4J8D7_9PEZI|nr:Galactose oxidase/kelch beta-propeller [Botryosphaeria dothidea]
MAAQACGSGRVQLGVRRALEVVGAQPPQPATDSVAWATAGTPTPGSLHVVQQPRPLRTHSIGRFELLPRRTWFQTLEESTQLPTPSHLPPDATRLRFRAQSRAMASPRLFLLLTLLLPKTHAQLPYHPTTIFRSTKDSDLIYVFGPAPSASNQAQLRSLDVSSDLDPANLNYNTLYSALPWSSSDKQTPYISFAETDGNFTVYAGACADPAQNAKIWSFEVDDGDDHGNGTWTWVDVVVGNADGASLLAPAFLSAGMSFSSSDDGSNASNFAFGGMCPYSDATQDNWQSSANYSNTMLQLAPDSASQYTLNVAPTRGPPVAEAGFALVGLPPTYSNNSDGSRDQQQNFVLIGGHTQNAYINMSQVALYSLPQETWTFLGVEQPSQEHTDLAIRDEATEVEPRSGHTALLTSDGSKIVVFGGWIGDVNTPADPQLAILNVGEGYGGDGPWHWTVPSTSGSGLVNGAGIYGHGAVMLSGDIMMIAGGYYISSTSSRFRSRADLAQNTQSFFFNVTSNTWLSQYSPATESSSGSSSGSNGQSSPSKAGLGAGLGIGLAAVLAMTLFYFWYKRYLRKKRQIREKEIERSLAHYNYNGNEPYGNGGDYADYISDREAAALAVDPWFLGGRQGWKTQQTQEAERTGLLVEIPSPTRGLRRSLHGRAYHQAPRYDESRMNQGSGGIHPIDEEDEIESTTNDRTAEGEALLGGRPNDIDNLPAPSTHPSSSGSDRESPNLIHTPVDFYAKSSFEPSREQDLDTTPVHKDEETLHKLAHAASSDTLDLSTPIDSSFATRDRSKSWIRGSVRLALARRPSSSHRHSNSHDRTQSLTSSGHRRRRHTNEDDGSGWFGSGGAGGSGTSSPTKLRRHRRSGSGVGVGESVSGTRPSTAGDSPSPPRRANSDASFWKSKRGSKAWSEEAPSPMWQSDVRDERDWALPTPDPGKSRESLVASMEGEDWDVEAAAEGRVVQVMFTVPRQRLRVVNVDTEQGSGDTSDETRSTRVPSESKGKQRVDHLAADDKPLPTPPAAAFAAADLLSDNETTPVAKGRDRAARPHLSNIPPPPLRPPPAAVAPPSPSIDLRPPGALPDLQPLHKPPPLSPAFPPDSDNALEPLAPPPSLSQLTRSTGLTTNASLISPYGTNPAASTSTLGTTITAPESPVRGRPSDRNLREARKEREARSISRGRDLLTPVKQTGSEERSKSRVSVRSEGGGSVKDLVKEIEARNRG